MGQGLTTGHLSTEKWSALLYTPPKKANRPQNYNEVNLLEFLLPGKCEAIPRHCHRLMLRLPHGAKQRSNCAQPAVCLHALYTYNTNPISHTLSLEYVFLPSCQELLGEAEKESWWQQRVDKNIAVVDKQIDRQTDTELCDWATATLTVYPLHKLESNFYSKIIRIFNIHQSWSSRRCKWVSHVYIFTCMYSTYQMWWWETPMKCVSCVISRETFWTMIIFMKCASLPPPK